jgi:membrane fusion protein, multidrug efflux system
MSFDLCSPCKNRPAAAPRVAAGLLALAVPSLIFSLAGCQQESSPTAEPTTVTVEVAPPLQRSDVVPYEYARGTTKAVDSVDLYCRVSGYLKKIGFTDGDHVTKEDKEKPLFLIDDAPFKAAYDKAAAEVKIREANAEYRAAELKRNRSLPPGAISVSELEQSIASKDEADASVVAAKAARDKAKLDLAYTVILAPITGRMSKRMITEGNLVVADKTLLSTIVAEDEMYVEFYLDEQTVLNVQQQIRDGHIKTNDKKNVPVAIRLGNETDYAHDGQLDFFDNVINSHTGTYLVRALLPNPKPAVGSRLLLPGMSVDVRMPIGMPEPALLVAERAVGSDLDQKYVYVLNDKNQAEKKMVELGTTSDGLRVVKKGLNVNDQVIVVGQQVAVRPNVTIKKKETKMTDYVPSQEAPAAKPQVEAPAAPAAKPGAEPAAPAAPTTTKKGE